MTLQEDFHTTILPLSPDYKEISQLEHNQCCKAPSFRIINKKAAMERLSSAISSGDGIHFSFNHLF